MNKQQKEKQSLIWKYFWKRKREEVWDFIKNLAMYCGFALWISSIAVSLSCFLMWAGGGPVPLLLICSCIIITLIGTLVLCVPMFIKWLRSNWKLATKDVIKELNLKGKNNGKNRS